MSRCIWHDTAHRLCDLSRVERCADPATRAAWSCGRSRPETHDVSGRHRATAPEASSRAHREAIGSLASTRGQPRDGRSDRVLAGRIRLLRRRCRPGAQRGGTAARASRIPSGSHRRRGGGRPARSCRLLEDQAPTLRQSAAGLDLARPRPMVDVLPVQRRSPEGLALDQPRGLRLAGRVGTTRRQRCPTT